MLNDSEFKPFSLTDFTVAEAPPEEPDSPSASRGDGEAEVEGSKISDRRVSFKSLMFDKEGDFAGYASEASAELKDGKSDLEKIRLSKDFKTAEFFRENSLLTNAEDFAETIRDGAKLYKTQLLAKIEEQATDTERIHQKTVAENQEADEERNKLLSATEDKVNEIKNEAFNEGFEAGRLEGMQKRYDEAERLVLQVNSVLEQLNSLRQVVRFQAEVELVELALRIAKNIVAEEIKIPNGVIKNIVQAALHETEVQGKIYVYLHPDDYEFLLKSKADLERYLSDEQTLAIRQNPGMKPGSIYVESDEEIISRSIEDQFNKLEKTLAEQKENRHAHLSEVDIDAHDFSIRPSSEAAVDKESAAAVHLQSVEETAVPEETEETESKEVDNETSTANEAEDISQETEQVDLSESVETGESEQPSGSEDISETKETDFSEETAEPALETELIEAAEPALETESAETGEQELETDVDESAD